MHKNNINKNMLRHPYVAVRLENGKESYGGNQSWLTSEMERSFGCGLIAAADILRYLRRRSLVEEISDETLFDDKGLGKEEYLAGIRELVKDFPVKTKLGITGFGLARRMNRIFRREGLGYRARWSIGKRHFQKRLPEMLEEDIPVLLSVGPGFFHKNESLPMYIKTEGGDFRKNNSMRDHYVTATGIERPSAGEKKDCEMIRISSWGNEYFIDLNEYLEHVRKNDNFLFSSLLYIQRK